MKLEWRVEIGAEWREEKGREGRGRNNNQKARAGGVARYCNQTSRRGQKCVSESVSDLIAKVSHILIIKVSTTCVAVGTTRFQIFYSDEYALIETL